MPDISISSTSLLEGGYVQFTLQLSAPLTQEVTVDYRSMSGTALRDLDFTSRFSAQTEGTVTFAAGETQKTFTVYAREDTIDETDEAFVIELYDPSGATFIGGAKVLRETVFILDDDGTGNDRGLFVSDPVIVEGDNGTRQAVFEIQISEPSATPLSFTYTTKNGSALAGQDYTARSGIVTFFSGQTRETVTVNLTGDGTIEASEFFHLVVSPTSAIADGGLGAVGTAKILDDDAGTGAQPVISVDAQPVVEGGYQQVTVTLSHASTDEVRVEYRSLMDTALRDDDFTDRFSAQREGTVIFAAGETQKTFTIYAREDNLDEADEAYTIEFFDPTNAALEGDGHVLRETAVILDDDGTGNNLALFVSDPVVRERDFGATEVFFEVELSQPTTTKQTFDYALQSGSAILGSDVIGKTSGQVTFAPGETKQAVRVFVDGDFASEPTEFIDLVVTPTSALADGGLGAAGRATILDDDSGKLPTLSLEVADTVEGGYVQATVRLSEPVVDQVTVQHRSVPGSALFDTDFTSYFSAQTQGTVTFAPGETQKTVTIYARQDNLDEPDESFVVELFSPTNAALAGGVSTLRDQLFILDDDGLGSNLVFDVTDTEVVEADGGRTQAVFEVELSQPVTSAMTLNYRVVGDTARAGQDFVAKAGTLRFAPGQTKAAVVVDVIGDRAGEGDETFRLVFDGPFPPPIAGAFTGALGVATILDDEIVGTRGKDNLLGTPFDDQIFGRGGNDVIYGVAGNDALYGEAGNDRINGGGGSDLIHGGRGVDTALFVGAPGGVSVSLSASGAQGTGFGRDRLVGIENLDGTGSADRLTGDGFANVLRGFGADDVLLGRGGNDRLLGAAGDDRLGGAAGNDLLVGSGGDDRAGGGGGNDVLRGGGGNDRLGGGGGSDQALGGGGNDRIAGGGGSDRLNGGGRNDVINGGNGNDDLIGKAGADRLIGGGGDDAMNGNGGADTFVFDARNEGDDTISSFRLRADTLAFAGQTARDVSVDIVGPNTVIDHDGGTIVLLGVRADAGDIDLAFI